ncbi:hypothetical protein C8R47DRAFT_1153210, partial [Mycena vitilis]
LSVLARGCLSGRALLWLIAASWDFLCVFNPGIRRAHNARDLISRCNWSPRNMDPPSKIAVSALSATDRGVPSSASSPTTSLLWGRESRAFAVHLPTISSAHPLLSTSPAKVFPKFRADHSRLVSPDNAQYTIHALCPGLWVVVSVFPCFLARLDWFQKEFLPRLGIYAFGETRTRIPS